LKYKFLISMTLDIKEESLNVEHIIAQGIEAAILHGDTELARHREKRIEQGYC